MIYTVSLNSSVDYTFYLPRIVHDDINKIRESRVDAGGKGLNVARMLTVLGCDCLSLAFLGGPNGDMLKTLLDAEKIKYRCVDIGGNVRNIFNFFISENESSLRFNEPGPKISEREERAFYRLLDSVQFRKGDTLSISGSLPPGMKKNTYRHIIEKVRGKGVLTALDADGDILKEGILGSPCVIKPNLWELERATGARITSFSLLERIFAKLLGKGISTILLTLGEKGAVLFSEKTFLYARPPAVKIQSTIGCGDAFLAGFLSGFSYGQPHEKSLRMAVACGAAKAMQKGTSMPDKTGVKKLLPRVMMCRLEDCSVSLKKALLKRAE